MNESVFREFWHYQVIDGKNMFTENGEPLRVLYPGRPNDIQGADFRDAVVVSGEQVKTGNVEIHLRSGDWRNHHHHLDPRYNSVILHVVRNHTAKTGTMLQNGQEIPVLELDKYLLRGTCPDEAGEIAGISGIPCSGIASKVSPETVFHILDEAGNRRFLGKAACFSEETIATGPGESLYRGMMKALGYSGNQTPFLRLAEQVPLAELESNRTGDNYLITIQAMLLGRAGFLSERFGSRASGPGICSTHLESLRHRWNASGENAVISPGEWQMFRIRPGNSPVRRLVAMSYLLGKYRDTGLEAGITGLVRNTVCSGNRRELEAALEVYIPDTGNPRKRISLLGKSRAAVIAVNVVLPFLYGITRDTELRKRVLECYRNYTKLPGNSLEKHMVMQLGINRREIKTAAHQQGLIHIYNEWCTKGRCAECVLGKLEAG